MLTSFTKRSEDLTLSPLDATYKRTDVKWPSRRHWSAKDALPTIVVLTLFTFTLYVYSTVPVNARRSSAPTPATIQNSTSADRPSSGSFTNNAIKHSSQTSEILSYAERNYTQALVVASTTREDTSWIARDLAHLESYIYVADDPEALYRPPQNKGRESMQYLTYIIDHYTSLPDISIFIHAENEAWHNNIIQHISMSRMLRHLLPSHVARVGFFNLRCHGESGCGGHIDLTLQEADDDVPEQIWLRRTWTDLHGPKVPMPNTLSAPCCSQFAASREAIESIPLERWIHYRDWLMDTSLSDSITGRIWEFTWHFILTGGKAELCPSMNACYCQGYGICFGSEARVENYLGLMEVDWFARKWQDTLRRGGGGYGVAEEIDDHMVTGARRQLGHRFQVARLKGRDPAVRAAAEDDDD